MGGSARAASSSISLINNCLSSWDTPSEASQPIVSTSIHPKLQIAFPMLYSNDLNSDHGPILTSTSECLQIRPKECETDTSRTHRVRYQLILPLYCDQISHQTGSSQRNMPQHITINRDGLLFVMFFGIVNKKEYRQWMSMQQYPLLLSNLWMICFLNSSRVIRQQSFGCPPNLFPCIRWV